METPENNPKQSPIPNEQLTYEKPTAKKVGNMSENTKFKSIG
jgi:hypothetical protein